MYKMITNIDIDSLGTSQATFLALSHAQLIYYSTGVKNFDGKPTNYKISLASFTMANHFQNNWSFSDHILPFQKSNNIGSRQSTYQEDGCTKLSPIVISMDLSPCTPRYHPFHTLYWLVTALVQTRLTENQWTNKSGRPPSQWQTNRKTPSILVLTSYLCLNFINLLDFFLVLCLMKVNDDSKGQKTFVMKTFQFWFYLI